jgi:hypothetical protein
MAAAQTPHDPYDRLPPAWLPACPPEDPDCTPPAPLDDAVFITQSVPASLQPGETASVSISMMNTGRATWTTAGDYKLGAQNPQDNTLWTGDSRVHLAEGASIAPGETAEFDFTITAPLAPGVRNFQWQMVHEGVQWFGEFTPNVVINVEAGASADDAAFVSQSGVPTTMSPGQTASVSVTMRNTGSAHWSEAQGYHLGSWNPQDNLTWGLNRAFLPDGASVAPGEEVTFRFSITAPGSVGTRDFQWRMVHDGVQWFGGLTQNVSITVGGGPGSGCSAANPNDNLPDDDALQDCLNQGGRIELLPGTPGYILAKGLHLTVDGTVLTSANAPEKSTLLAAPQLDAPLFSASARSGFTLEYLRFDGNKEERMSYYERTGATRKCVDYRDFGTTIIIDGDSNHFTLRNSELVRARCGTALQIDASNFEVAHNLIADNGFRREELPDAGLHPHPWSDGITLGRCAGGHVHHNNVVNNTDVGIINGGGVGCVVEANTISQTTTHAFAGLGVHNFTGSGNGDQTDAVYRDNIITSAFYAPGQNGLDFGISAGIHPWFPTDSTRRGSIVNNSVSGAVVNLAVDGYYDGLIRDNQLGSFQGTFSFFINCTIPFPAGFAGYTVAHADGSTLQPGFVGMSFDGGTCSLVNASSTGTPVPLPTLTPSNTGTSTPEPGTTDTSTPTQTETSTPPSNTTPTSTPTPTVFSLPTLPVRTPPCHPRQEGCHPSRPFDGARIVSNTIPRTMIAGLSYRVNVSVINTGRSTWTRSGGGPPDGSVGYNLGAVGDEDPFAPIRIQLRPGIVVPPRGRYTFSFTMKAPLQAGSYLTDWSMVHEPVNWFGTILSKTVQVVSSVPIATRSPSRR